MYVTWRGIPEIFYLLSKVDSKLIVIKICKLNKIFYVEYKNHIFVCIFLDEKSIAYLLTIYVPRYVHLE